MGMFGGSIRLVSNRSFLSLSDSRQLYRVSIGCLVHAAAAASVHHTYVGEDRRILASPCTGLSTDRSPFFLCPLSAPLLFKQVLRSTSLAGLPFRLGLGRVMDAIGYSSGLLAPICILSVAGRSIVFKVIWIFVYYICILNSWSRVVYIYLFCGSHRGLLCNVITSFSTRTQVPGGHL